MASVSHVQDIENRQKTVVGDENVSVLQYGGRKLLREYSEIPTKKWINILTQ
jgi:hypothetical protein